LVSTELARMLLSRELSQIHKRNQKNDQIIQCLDSDRSSRTGASYPWKLCVPDNESTRQERCPFWPIRQGNRSSQGPWIGLGAQAREGVLQERQPVRQRRRRVHARSGGTEGGQSRKNLAILTEEARSRAGSSQALRTPQTSVVISSQQSPEPRRRTV
jgi:hypothetical protein